MHVATPSVAIIFSTMFASIIFASSVGMIMACPGSPVKMHASCDMGVTFTNSCQDVIQEMSTRVTSDQWIDPHNGGTYTITNQTDTYLAGQRVTGDSKYTDKFDFTFTATDSGCQVEACSESQVNSMKDFSTNYCNLHDLYCSEKDGCTTVGKTLSYSEKYSSCSEHDSSVCVSSASLALSTTKKTEVCPADIKVVTADIASASVAMAQTVSDCRNPGSVLSDVCNSDVGVVLKYLTNASAGITAVHDCGEVPEACVDDVESVLTDIVHATVAITDAMVDCAEATFDEAKCLKDVAASADALAHGKFDLEVAVLCFVVNP